MKILLVAINSKYIHTNPAVYSLKACAGEAAELVEIAEYTINQPLAEIRGDLCRRRPDVLGFSCYIWNISCVEALVWDLARLLPETDLWLGGPEVSFDPEAVRQRLPVTGVLAGPGERTFAALADRYRRGLPAPEQRIQQGKAPLPLAQIPFWYGEMELDPHRILYYESSRGCPFSCSYCLSSLEKHLDFKPLPQVERELDWFLEKRVPQVKFIDRTFNCRREHALAIWRFLRGHDNGVTNFHFEISADLLDGEMLEVLRGMRPGAVQLEIGVQTTNRRTLEAIHRPMDFDKLARTVREIHSWGNIHQHLDLIAGLPWEDYASFRRSFDQVYALRPQQLQLGFLKVLKGTEMERRAEEFGILCSRTPPYQVLATRWLSWEEVLRLEDVEKVVETYYNSGQFLYSLELLEEWFGSPFALYEELADFHRRQGLMGVQPSRIRKYEILLEFFREQEADAERQAAFRERLLVDCYARENIKNRPSFGGDLSLYRPLLREWARREAETHAVLPHYRDCGARELERALHLEVVTEMTGGLPRLLVMDYRRRNPLNHNADILFLPLEGEEIFPNIENGSKDAVGGTAGKELTEHGTDL